MLPELPLYFCLLVLHTESDDFGLQELLQLADVVDPGTVVVVPDNDPHEPLMAPDDLPQLGCLLLCQPR